MFVALALDNAILSKMMKDTFLHLWRTKSKLCRQHWHRQPVAHWNPTALSVRPSLSGLRPEVAVLVREHELDSVEEVGLARAVPAHHHVVAGVERLHHRLLAVGLEALDDDLEQQRTTHIKRRKGEKCSNWPI